MCVISLLAETETNASREYTVNLYNGGFVLNLRSDVSFCSSYVYSAHLMQFFTVVVVVGGGGFVPYAAA